MEYKLGYNGANTAILKIYIPLMSSINEKNIIRAGNLIVFPGMIF